jgi:hypothetical protein
MNLKSQFLLIYETKENIYVYKKKTKKNWRGYSHTKPARGSAHVVERNTNLRTK